MVSPLPTPKSPDPPSSDRTREPDREGRDDTAAYIAAMCAELGRTAHRHHLDTLAYILELAKLEADNERHTKAVRRSTSSGR